MTREEFEERACIEVSVEEYAKIEQEYMNLPDELNIYKDEFCKLYRYSRPDSSVANYLLLQQLEELKEKSGEIDTCRYLIRESYKELSMARQEAAD